MLTSKNFLPMIDREGRVWSPDQTRCRGQETSTFPFGKILGGISQIFILLIKIYQNSLALIFPHSCRFYPSCSEYGILALKKFGLFKGIWLTIKRIGKCHPLHPGGYDPI